MATNGTKRSMRKAKEIQRKAKNILRSPNLFPQVLSAVERAGLVGEKRNASVLFVVTVSRLLKRPLNAIIKGGSSTGKNWLASRVLQLLPKKCVREITGVSDRAWNYANNKFKHRVVYIQERNESAG